MELVIELAGFNNDGSCHHVPLFRNKDRNLPLTKFSSDSSTEGTEGNASQIKALPILLIL